MATQATQASPNPQEFILQVVSGYWYSRSVAAAAHLGIADLIHERPRPVNELASETGTNADALYRLMRALAGGGVFAEHDGRTFGHTPLSEALKSGVPGSLRDTAISELDTDHYLAWEHLLYSVRTGGIAFDQRFGVPIWQYYNENPEIGQRFERSMTGITQRIHDAVVAAYPVAGFDCILDVGGGEGFLLRRMLRENPRSRGILFDQAEVIAQARTTLASSNGMADRISLVAGDFFEAVPSGADLQVLKWIVHDWNDTQSNAILRACRKSIRSGGRLVLLEAVIRPGTDGLFNKLMDLNMLVMTGGRERTEEEFRTLLAGAGFRLERVITTASPVCVIEAVPV